MTYQAFTDYGKVRADMASLLAQIASPRLVTQKLQDYERWPAADRADGVFTVLAGPRTDYNYEHRPGDLPRVRIFVYGERRLEGKDPGEAIDAEEDAMARELEELAAQAPHTPGLEPLILQSITPSAQTATPFAQVLAVFVYGVDPQ